MKKFIAILILALFSTLAQANPTPSAASVNESIVKAIRAAVKLPEELRSSITHERVLVVFQVDENGQIVVQSVGTRLPQLQNSVIHQMESIALGTFVHDSTKVYSIWLDFKVM